MIFYGCDAFSATRQLSLLSTGPVICPQFLVLPAGKDFNIGVEKITDTIGDIVT